MNYERIYNQLIERAKNRSVEGYIERHHIIPKCMGGTDDLTNLVDLTPEEHFVAHQLLVKMFPENPTLIYAAQMMCVSSKNQRRNNRSYGWLKRKYSGVCKQRIGEKNGATGSFWITDGVANKKIKGEIPEGWKTGRVLSILKKPNEKKCCCCGIVFLSNKKSRKYCSRKCSSKNAFNITKAVKSVTKSSDEEILFSLIENNFDLSASMMKLGYKPNQYGHSRNRFIEIKNKNQELKIL